MPLSMLFAAMALPRMILTDVNIVDVKSLSITKSQALCIEGKRIKWIKSASEVTGTDQSDGKVVNGKGGFLIPGLIDSHIHFNNPYRESRLMLAHGVTAARDMAGNNIDRINARKAAQEGKYGGFTFITTGAILDGEPAYHPGSRPCPTPEAGRQAVIDQAALKIDQIKVYSGLKKEVYQAIVEEAKKLKIPFAGHVPDALTIEEAAAAGQRTIEHLYRAQTLLTDLIPNFKSAPTLFEAGVFSRYQDVDKTALRARLRALSQTGSAICPTLILLEGQGRMPISDERMKAWREYALPSDIDAWTSKVPEQYAAYGDSLKDNFDSMLAFTKALSDAGIPLIVGTDLANGYTLAGRAVLDEMNLWQRAGISSGKILQSATLVPARVLDMKDTGFLAPGMFANMVLLRENPLLDIAALKSVQSLWAQGKHHDSAAIRRLLAEAKQDLQRDAVNETAPVFPTDSSPVTSKGTVQHFFGPYPDVAESFAIRGENASFRGVLNSRTFGRVPLIAAAKAGRDGTLNISLKAHAVLPSDFKISVSPRSKIGFVLTPLLGLDNFQLKRLAPLPLPRTMNVITWKSRQTQTQEQMVLEQVPATPNGPNLRLRSLSQKGVTVDYWLAADGSITQKQMNEFSSLRSAKLDLKPVTSLCLPTSCIH